MKTCIIGLCKSVDGEENINCENECCPCSCHKQKEKTLDSQIYDMQINTIRNDFSNYCQSCRDGISDCPENVRFREESPGAIHLLLRYIDQVNDRLKSKLHSLLLYAKHQSKDCRDNFCECGLRELEKSL